MAVLGLDSPIKVFLFLGYVIFWATQQPLIHSSQLPGAVKYSTPCLVLVRSRACLEHVLPASASRTLVIDRSRGSTRSQFLSRSQQLVNLVKICMSTGGYLIFEGGPAQLAAAAYASRSLLLPLSAPALLYTASNNLQIVNLKNFDPGVYTTFNMASNVVMGLTWQFVFGVYLDRWQWLSLLLISIGCGLTALNFKDVSATMQCQLQPADGRAFKSRLSQVHALSSAAAVNASLSTAASAVATSAEGQQAVRPEPSGAHTRPSLTALLRSTRAGGASQRPQPVG